MGGFTWRGIFTGVLMRQALRSSPALSDDTPVCPHHTWMLTLHLGLLETTIPLLFYTSLHVHWPNQAPVTRKKYMGTNGSFSPEDSRGFRWRALSIAWQKKDWMLVLLCPLGKPRELEPCRGRADPLAKPARDSPISSPTWGDIPRVNGTNQPQHLAT